MINLNKYKIAVVDGRSTVLKAFNDYFVQSSSFDLTITANSVEEFYKKQGREHLDILLCGVEPAYKTVRLLCGAAACQPNPANVVLWRAFDDKKAIFEGILAGATGYLPELAPIPVVESRLLAHRKGTYWISPGLARSILNYFEQYDHTNNLPSLSKMESFLLQTVSNGASVRGVAERLKEPEFHVHALIQKLYQKLHVTDLEKSCMSSDTLLKSLN
ncbi:hypothetical protein [Sphingobacterium sp. LRF_L2]|uniref:hypothetical protein n=1 Tax=Sphingobacterium sp. LRF_L2 TaxID=3369421 RepID=UPI003F5E46FE